MSPDHRRSADHQSAHLCVPANRYADEFIRFRPGSILPGIMANPRDSTGRFTDVSPIRLGASSRDAATYFPRQSSR
jgi:hypothetical protein